MSDYNALTFNLAGSVRRETLHGKEHIVAPMAMLTEGVHNGSGGPLLYKAEDVKKAVPAWNMKPIVVYHPEINGAGVSACDRDILEKQQVGMVMNTRWDGKLRAEAWIDVQMANLVDDRVIEALEEGRIMEVSTGLFTDNLNEAGVWGDEPFGAIATNHQPDHLALLPDKIGACSIADGAGLLQLNGDAVGEEARNSNNSKEKTMEKEAIVDGLIANTENEFAAEDKTALMDLDVAILNKMGMKKKKSMKKGDKEEIDDEEDDVVANSEEGAKPVTAEDYISQAPAEIQEVLRNGLNSHNQAKTDLVEKITANSRNKFSAEFLGTKSLEELEGLAALAEEPAPAAPTANSEEPLKTVPMFSGQATPAAPTNNEGEGKEEALKAPTMNFDAE